MYDGTVTMSDPALVESFDLDEQTTAYILHDYDAGAPDWEGLGFVYRLSYDHARYDDVVCAGDMGDEVIPMDRIRDAWDQYRDMELVARYLRAFHGAVSVDYSEGLARDARVLAVVTGTQADAWGVERDSWPDLAGQALESVRPYFEGAVYGVVVVNTITGDEEAVWNVYDGTSDLSYCRETAEDIAPIGVTA
jgi:hypothetical protein